MITLETLREALATLPDIIRQPAADPFAAVLLVVLALLAFAIMAVLVLLAVQGTPVRRRAAGRLEAEGESEAEVAELEPVRETQGARGRRRTRAPRPARRRLAGRGVVLAGALVVLMVASAWTVVGVATQRRVACESCHAEDPHMRGDEHDPHAVVSCVACHEYGTPLAFASVNTLERFAHMVSGRFEGWTIIGYGTAGSSTACVRCHADAIEGVQHNLELGIRMSHAEPLEAGAECVDCHALINGLISAHTIGMETCLRCHDGQEVSAECRYCHTADTAMAVRVDPPPEPVARRQLARPQCGSCHEDQSECDACHGIRMPHTGEFVVWAHARDGVIDLWENDGRTCATCHDDGDQTPCAECHEPFLAHGDRFRDQHGRGVSYSNPGCTCHDRMAHRIGRNFCELCHDSRPEGAAP